MKVINSFGVDLSGLIRIKTQTFSSESHEHSTIFPDNEYTSTDGSATHNSVIKITRVKVNRKKIIISDYLFQLFHILILLFFGSHWPMNRMIRTKQVNRKWKHLILLKVARWGSKMCQKKFHVERVSTSQNRVGVLTLTPFFINN